MDDGLLVERSKVWVVLDDWWLSTFGGCNCFFSCTVCCGLKVVLILLYTLAFVDEI